MSLASRGAICSIFHPHSQSVCITCVEIPVVSIFYHLELPNSSFVILWPKSAEILSVQNVLSFVSIFNHLLV